MSDHLIRPFRAEDTPQLRALWQIAFGDGDEYIDSFFESFLRPGACVVAEVGGRVVSAMYMLPGQTLYPYRKNTLTAGYTYALATLPEYRGRGIGRAVYRAASDKVLESADAACVLPAEKGLYPFYEEASGARPVSFVREARFRREELASLTPCMAARLPTLEYALMRGSVLSGYPHAALSDEMFEHLERTGTEFFVIPGGVAAAETEDGVCRITELLDPGTEEDVMRAVAGVARWCRAEGYIVRSPVFFDGPGKIRPFMLAALGTTPDYPMPGDLWWGFGLD